MWKVLKIALISAGLLVALLGGGIWFFLHHIQEEFWADLRASRRVDRIRFAEIPAVVRTAILVAEGKDFFECERWSEIRILYREVFSIGPVKDRRRPNCSISTSVLGPIFSQKHMSMGAWHIRIFLGFITMHSRLSNEEIFEEFANRIYLGQNQFGLRDGAKFYFRKELAKLAPADAAGLAAIIRNPAMYDPKKNKQRFEERRKQVLFEMKVK